MEAENSILIFIDGSCWPNPNGNMGTGIFCVEAVKFSLENKNTRNIKSTSDSTTAIHSGCRKFKFGEYQFAETSNNMAEHLAFTEALLFINKSIKENNKTPFIIFSDSDLVVKQMNGEYKVNHRLAYSRPALENVEMLRELKEKCSIEIIWIPRDFNQKADELSKY